MQHPRKRASAYPLHDVLESCHTTRVRYTWMSGASAQMREWLQGAGASSQLPDASLFPDPGILIVH